jgi:hypothetical protein
MDMTMVDVVGCCWFAILVFGGGGIIYGLLQLAGKWFPGKEK